MVNAWFLFMLLLPQANTSSSMAHRPQKLAAVRAHSILPSSLRWIVRKHGQELFLGLEQGMAVPSHRVDIALVQHHQERISLMIKQRAQFEEVVLQMGYMAGLLAVLLDPSAGQDPVVRRGFEFYLNFKLAKFLFVFEGYGAVTQRFSSMKAYLDALTQTQRDYQQVLRKYYGRVNGHFRYPFDERSAVFGVCSIYFSQLAGACAHLWRDAWARANGDLSGTPFMAPQRTPLVVTPSTVPKIPSESATQMGRVDVEPSRPRRESY